ncbi:hypothetical protein ACPTGO_30880, partial [Pseudomonas aeruginosa]|uniref:hypothetical protein n=1 Tax=Pseudomonas aeruginosa TaxID=287 RepID=UPI003CC69B2B
PTGAVGLNSTSNWFVVPAWALWAFGCGAENPPPRGPRRPAGKAAHADTIKMAVATQAAWQTGKLIVYCPMKDEEEEWPPQ